MSCPIRSSEDKVKQGNSHREERETRKPLWEAWDGSRIYANEQHLTYCHTFRCHYGTTWLSSGVPFAVVGCFLLAIVNQYLECGEPKIWAAVVALRTYSCWFFRKKRRHLLTLC